MPQQGQIIDNLTSDGKEVMIVHGWCRVDSGFAHKVIIEV